MDCYSSRALALAYRVAYFIPLYWVSHGKFPLRKCRDSPGLKPWVLASRPALQEKKNAQRGLRVFCTLAVQVKADLLA